MHSTQGLKSQWSYQHQRSDPQTLQEEGNHSPSFTGAKVEGGAGGLVAGQLQQSPELRILGNAKSDPVVHIKGLVKEGLVAKMSFTVGV